MDAAGATRPLHFDFAKPGPFAAGFVNFEVTDPTRGRLLAMTLWYPAVPAASEPASVATAFYTGEKRAALDQLLADSPAGCATRFVPESGSGVPVAAPKSWPLVAFSHCHTCTRVSSFSLAERLATFGIAVIAPDHTGNTLFDKLEGKAAGLSQATLAERTADIRFALDVALDATGTALPAHLRGRFDITRVGAFGHSFGAVTTGRVLQTDPRVRVGLAIAAPMENPLLPGVIVSEIQKPILWLLASEDDSITAAGLEMMRENYANAKAPAWLVEVADAGHFTFSDIAGLKGFGSGCGNGKRLGSGEPFAFMANSDGRTVAMRVVAAFFAAHLLADDRAAAGMAVGLPVGVTVHAKP